MLVASSIILGWRTLGSEGWKGVPTDIAVRSTIATSTVMPLANAVVLTGDIRAVGLFAVCLILLT